MRRRIIPGLFGVGIVIHELLFLGALLRLYYVDHVSGDQQAEYLAQALPFITIFVIVLLTYIGLVALVAIVQESRRKRSVRMLIWFGLFIHECMVIGAVARLYLVDTPQLAVDQQERVLLEAISFLAVFIAMLLTYICLIVMVAVVMNGRVPRRTYFPVEWLIIGGVALGVVGLFQPWAQGGFEYGFWLLLVSLLSFIVWSHITPQSPTDSATLLPLSARAHAGGVIAGALVAILFAATVSTTMIENSEMKPPYGVSPKLWELMFSDEQKEVLNEDADDQWNGMRPVFLLASLLPGAFVYFIGREIAAYWWDSKNGGVPLPPGDTEPVPGMAGDPAPG
ncbi:MAG: hypothetical protein GYB65_01250 [Chloroflexi bacterium]|nr:hypothetical protein [Chloroflexota bacterium]